MNRGSTRAGGEKASTRGESGTAKTANHGGSKPPVWETLQQSLGNQGTQRLVEREQLGHARQRAEAESLTPISDETQHRIDAQREGGSGLDSATREGVRQATGLNLQDAQLHSGPEVDRLAHEMHARAFTQGRDVFLGSRGRDQATLTHELTHVAQGRTGPGVVQRAPEEPEEIEMPAEYVGTLAPRPEEPAGAGDAYGADAMAQDLTSIVGGEAAPTTVNEDTGPQVTAPQPAGPQAGGAVEATGGLAEAPQPAEDEEEPQRQVSMRLPGPGEGPTYIDKPKKPAPAPHETLDPRTEAIIENKQIRNDRGDMVNPLGPINRDERREKAWDQAKWDEQNRAQKKAKIDARIQKLRDEGKLSKRDKGAIEEAAIDMISGEAEEAPLTSTPSIGGEPEPDKNEPTIKPKEREEKKEPEPFVPQKFSFALTIDKITKEYKDLTAEATIAELKWRWISVRGYIDVYKEWHRDILANREDHPVVGFVVDTLGRRDPPSIRIWEDLESSLGEAIKVIDLDIPALRSDFEEKERGREEADKRRDDERAAEGRPRLLPFQGLNPKWATRADWEKYMERHIRGAVQSLQKAAHRIEARRKEVFRYKEGTIETTEDAIKALKVAKKAGQIAASLLPVGRGLSLLKTAIVSTGLTTAYNAGQEAVTQGSEMVFSDRTEFDFAKIAKGAVKDAVVGFVGAMTGGALGRYLGGALARRFAGRFSKETIESLQMYLVEPLSNGLSSPITTTTRVVMERAVGDRKKISAGDLVSEIVNGLPEDIVMGFVGSRINKSTETGGAWYERPTQANVAAPPPSPETTAPAPVAETATTARPTPQTALLAPGGETATVARPAEAPAPAPVTETVTTRPAEAPVPAPAGDAPAPVATTQAPAPVPQPVPVARQTPPGGLRGGRRSQAVTREVPSVNAAPTRDMRAVTEPDATNLSVGDRRTTTRAVPEDAGSTRRTEPSEAELAVGDRRTTIRAVDDAAQRTTERRPANEEPDAIRGPAEPVVRDLPPGSVHRELSYIEAYRSYNASVRQNPRFEAGIWRNRVTGEHVVVEGQREFVDPTQLFTNPDFRTSKGQPVDPSSWHMVEHFHPGWGDKRQFFNRFPSPEDYQAILNSQRSRGVVEAVRSQIRAKDPVSGKDVITEYGYDPSNTAQPYWIRYKDQSGATVTERFSNQSPWDAGSAYRQFVERQAAAEPAANLPPTNLPDDLQRIPTDESATGAWRIVEPPVPDATAPTPAAPAQRTNTADTTQQTPAVARPGDATQRMPAVGPAGPADVTQRMQAVGPAGPADVTQRMPAVASPTAAPGAGTQRMPAQDTTQRSDAFATTQEMPAQGARGPADATTPRAPAGSGSRPTGPVEVVPVQNASDARILMQDWPGDRPLRLLANGEARAAWNRDYGQPGDPPPAWFDPRHGLVVDTDQVRTPTQERGTYHVPAENAYVMFNIETPREVASIYRQNEAANATQGSQTARSLLLDHDTFVRTFEAARGWAPDTPAGFVDQNGRLYVDVSRVDITTQADVAVTGNAPPRQLPPSGKDVAGAPTARQDIAGAPTLPQGGARPLGGDDALAATAPQDPAFAPTAPQANGGQGGRPRLSDTAGGADSLPGSNVQPAPPANDSVSQPRVNPYETMRPVERIDDPVHAAQLYANFQELPAHRRGRVRAMETADFQAAWRLSGAGQDPARPAPVAWVDSHGNLLIDFDRANLDLGGVPRGPVRRGEPIQYPAGEPYNQPAPLRGVYRPGEPRGLTREIHSFEEAQRLWTAEVMANREVRALNMNRDVLVDLWQHTYGGQGDAPPLAWIDAQGFLVVDQTRVPMPDAVWGELARTAPP